MSRVATALGIALAVAAAGCPGPFCDRSGCDATSGPAQAGIEQGVAGAVSSASDVVENGCATCPLASAELGVFATAQLVEDEAGLATALESDPVATVQADGRWEQALDAGTYVVCHLHDDGAANVCVPVEVVSGGVTTVHLRFVFGPTTFRVFDADGQEIETATIDAPGA